MKGGRHVKQPSLDPNLRPVSHLCFVFTSPSLARSSFDGAWSVVVVTRAGACTPTLRYPVSITNGIVTNAGDSPASVSGRVAPTGAVRVTVQSGGS
jgi:hypothetical protein